MQRWIRLVVAASLLGACGASAGPGGGVPPVEDDGGSAPVSIPSPDASAGSPTNPTPTPDAPLTAPIDTAAVVDSGTATAKDVARSSDAAAPASGDDPPPDRPLMVDKTSPQLYTIKFKPSDADPAAGAPDDTQTAFVDTSKELRGKLVVCLSGTSNPPGPVGVGSFAAGLGFHAYVIAYHNGYNPSTQNNPDYFGNSRFNELDGMGRAPGVQVKPPDSVDVRVAKALVYLQMKNAAGDWGYFLDKSGQVRWSDVIFIGHSHGATSAAAFAKKHRVWRAISLSGPRDTNPVTASWLSLPSATPIDRYYGFTGTGDSQHSDHIKSMQVMGYVGELTSVEGAQPPFNNSHRLRYNGGHGGSANCGNYAAVCKYMFGVP